MNFRTILTVLIPLFVLGVSEASAQSSQGGAHVAGAHVAGPSGGSGGAEFEDVVPDKVRGVLSISVCSGDLIDSIQMTVLNRFREMVIYAKHGGDGGSCQTLVLSSGEFITEISGRSGQFVDSLVIRTNLGAVLTAGGTGGSLPFRYTAANDRVQIVGFMGRSGDFLDAFGVVYRQLY